MPEFLIEYGDGQMSIQAPEKALVMRPGHNHQYPPAVDPFSATREALEKPLGMPALRHLVKPGDRVVIAFPDRVKGGVHETSHRRVAIPLILADLDRAGIAPKDVKLVCAIGLHRKNTEAEFRSYLGEDLVNEFWPDRLVCHDAEDSKRIVAFPKDSLGNTVEFNREVAEADLAVLIGHVVGNPYGGYSGGYKMPATGLTTWRSIRSHHVPGSLYRKDFLPVNTRSHFRDQLRSIGQCIEAGIGKKFFLVDAVLGTDAQVLGVYAGAADEVERESWKLAERRTNAYLPEKVDVLVLGLPRSFHYGPGMGTNPILMLQALGATLVRCFDIFNPGGVIIAASVCDGWFNEEWFPATPEIFSLFQNVSTQSEMARFEEEVSTRPVYVHKYRQGIAYHPFHGFSMLYMGGLAAKHASAIVIVGSEKPDFARAMGCIPAHTFAEAITKAEKYVGRNPRMLVLPEYLTKTPVHLRLRREGPGSDA